MSVEAKEKPSKSELTPAQKKELKAAKRYLEEERVRCAEPAKRYKLTQEEIAAKYGPPGNKKGNSLDGVRFMKRKNKEEELMPAGRPIGSKNKPKGDKGRLS